MAHDKGSSTQDKGSSTQDMSQRMREMAEGSVNQAKRAYEQYISATEKAMNAVEDSTRAAWTGAREVNQRMMAFADANAKAGFDYAERMVQAKDSKEVLALQQEFLRTQSERLKAQMTELTELAARAAREAMKPKS
jgi:phasin